MEVPINFLDSKLCPKVHCSAPAMDNYEVSNLISESFVVRSRGFLAYSTAKPPVKIEFTTICDINIYYIVVGMTVGAQRSTGIEIYFKINSQYYLVGKANENSDGFVFFNRKLYVGNKIDNNILQNYSLKFFNSYNSTDTICFKIFRTEKSVPCISKVEIWGKASKKCSPTTICTLSYLLGNKKLLDSNLTLKEDRNNPSNEFNIPEEYLDSLTFEIMAIPLTLPSGNTIDESTLEKFTSTEASLGRKPSDPFTGQNFTENRKPVFNSSLKSRIDMFLLENSHRKETFQLKRTVGNCIGPKRKVNCDEDSVKLTSDVHELKKTKQTVICSGDGKLDQLLEQTMNSNNFVRFTTLSNVNDNIVNCDKFNKCISCNKHEILYSISCDHLYCKFCLLSISKNLICTVCQKLFTKDDIKKYNVHTSRKYI